jgi:hypothetical protein
MSKVVSIFRGITSRPRDVIELGEGWTLEFHDNNRLGPLLFHPELGAKPVSTEAERILMESLLKVRGHQDHALEILSAAKSAIEELEENQAVGSIITTRTRLTRQRISRFLALFSRP